MFFPRIEYMLRTKQVVNTVGVVYLCEWLVDGEKLNGNSWGSLKKARLISGDKIMFKTICGFIRRIVFMKTMRKARVAGFKLYILIQTLFKIQKNI